MSSCSDQHKREICRLCSQQVSNAVVMQIQPDFYVKFKEITNYELFDSPKLSSILCPNCQSQFEDFYNYRQQLIKSQFLLNRLIIIPKVHVKPETQTFPEMHSMTLNNLNMFDEVQLEQIWPKVDMDGEIAKNEAETLSEEIDQFEDQFDSFEEINESSLSSLCFSQKSDVDLSSSKETRKMITAQESRKLNQRNKGESKTEYECDKCGKKLKRKHSVRLHMVVHDNALVKHSYLPCHLRRKHCEKKYQKQSSKQMKSSFQCDICGKELLNANKLIYHMGTIHTDGEFKCKLCDHIAKNKYQQNTHFTRVHKRDRCCEICGHWFSSKDFGLHMKPKNHVYPYTCSVEGCLRAFTTTNGLDAHERFFHKKVLMVRSARYVTEHFQRYRNFNELLRQIKSNLFVNLTIFSLSNFSSRSFFAAKVCDSCGIRSKLKSIIKLSRDLIK